MPSVELSIEKLKSSVWRGGERCSNMAMSIVDRRLLLSKRFMKPSKSSLFTSAAELSEMSSSLVGPVIETWGYDESSADCSMVRSV